MNHHQLLRKHSAAYARWIRSLPLMEWTPLRIPEGSESAIIGLICCLIDDGTVKATFNNSCTFIRRDPATEEEYQEWLDSSTNNSKITIKQFDK